MKPKRSANKGIKCKDQVKGMNGHEGISREIQ
jgi:hypothetical protein